MDVFEDDFLFEQTFHISCFKFLLKVYSTVIILRFFQQLFPPLRTSRIKKHLIEAAGSTALIAVIIPGNHIHHGPQQRWRYFLAIPGSTPQKTKKMTEVPRVKGSFYLKGHESSTTKHQLLGDIRNRFQGRYISNTSLSMPGCFFVGGRLVFFYYFTNAKKHLKYG